MKREAEHLSETPEPESPRESGVYVKNTPGFRTPAGPRRETQFSIRVQERPSIAALLATTIPKAPRLPTRVGPLAASTARARRRAAWIRAAVHSALVFAGVTMLVLAAAVLLS